MRIIHVNLYDTLRPNKIKHVKEITSIMDKYPCEVCKHLTPHKDLETGLMRPCKYRKYRCNRKGKCKYFDRAGKTSREAQEWRKLNAWR